MIDDLDTRTKQIPDDDKLWTYIGGVAYRGPHGITSTDPNYSPVSFINGKNPIKELEVEFIEGAMGYQIDGDTLIDLDSSMEDDLEHSHLQYILVDASSYTQCMTDLKETYYDLHAIVEGDPNCAMVLPYNCYTTNFGTVFADAYYIGKLLFPNQFSDLDYNDGNVYDEIYKKFLGKGVYSDMADAYNDGFHEITLDEIGF